MDAGAQGFVSFLEGMKNFIEKGKLNEKKLMRENQANIEFNINANEDYNYQGQILYRS